MEPVRRFARTMIGGDEAQKSAAPPATAAAAARGTRPRWVPASRRSSSAAMVEEEEEESTASSAAAGGGVIPRSDTGVKARVISPGWWEERERERVRLTVWAHGAVISPQKRLLLFGLL